MTPRLFALPPNARLEHQRLLALINSMTDGVIALDEKVRIVSYNGAALDVLDVNTIAPGQPLRDSLHPIDKHDKPVDIDELISATKTATINRDLRLRYGDGSFINLYLAIAPVHLGFGKAGQRGFVVQLRDITREKSLEEERDEFISVVSHELRTPIAVVEGNLSNARLIAERAGADPKIQTALKNAYDQAGFLANLVNDLAMLSRAERGVMTTSVSAINVHDLLAGLAKSYEPEAKTKNLSLVTNLDPALELLTSNELYVREILQNFITNALKYTQRGSITLSTEPAANGVRFGVADTGIGISQADRQKIFTKFFRPEDYRTRESSGTGLGLYVTMKLAKLIHAEITVASTLNKGSTFTILVPNLDRS